MFGRTIKSRCTETKEIRFSPWSNCNKKLKIFSPLFLKITPDQQSTRVKTVDAVDRENGAYLILISVKKTRLQIIYF
jgi:hypothetical protein